MSGDSSSSKSLLWMMVALFAGLGILLGGGLFLAGRVMRSLGISASTSRETVHTRTGSYRLERENQIGPVMPVYPTASLVLPGEEAVREAAKEESENRSASVYHTTDAREYVDEWYQKHLNPEFTRRDSGTPGPPEALVAAHLPAEDIAFFAQRGNMVRIVALSFDAGGTKISLIRVDQPAVQPVSATP